MRHPASRGRLGRTSAMLTVLIALTAAPAGHAENRLVQRFDHRSGLPVSNVNQIAQDPDGFLWIATVGGLVRYDGIEMRPWGRGSDNGTLDRIFVGLDGEVLLRKFPERTLLRVAGEDLEPVVGPDGRPVAGLRHGTFAPDGRLWLVVDDGVLSRQAGHWTAWGPEHFDGEIPSKVGPPLGGQTLLITNRGVWKLDAERGPTRVLAMDRILDVEPHPSGSLFVVRSTDRATLVEIRRDERIEHGTVSGQRAELAVRGDAIWLGHSRGLAVLRPGRGLHAIDSEQFENAAASLMVDREGSLWFVNFLGLFQFPEPDTVVWNLNDGLPIDRTRFLARTDEGVWVSTWGGMASLEGASWEAVAHTPRMVARNKLCVDGHGRLWTDAALDEGPSRRTAALERREGRFVIHEFPNVWWGRCAAARDGTVWLPREDRLLKTRPEGGRPTETGTVPFPSGGGVVSLWESDSGTLWAGDSMGFVCHVRVSEIDDEKAWTCESLPTQQQILALLGTPSGAVWAGTTGGVFRRVEERWELVPASRDLPASRVLNLRASSSGGIWVVGSGALIRVSERLDSPAGWEILESPGIWQGIPTSGAGDVLEDADGTLWLTTSMGVVQVPPQARAARPAPPPVRLVNITVDGQGIPMDEQLELPYHRNRMELSFAALSYRDPGRIRYRVRARPDSPWSESRISGFRFVDLRPGHYQPEVIASIDGEHWSKEPARFAFTVLAPWYRRWWAIALYALAGIAALTVAYRIRVAVLLRLERQRTRIAMDLHDEMGSGLGSIGLLADLVSDRTVGDDERNDLAGKISTTAIELGASLTDIIWSLRARSATLEALGNYLRERARLIIPDRRIRVETDFPETWPTVTLSLASRRNVQRIAVEALHNVARHARASRVIVGLGPERGRRWQMWIEDDGRGIPEKRAPRGGSGLGLESMQKRAEQIGGRIEWSRGDHGGTRVELVFDPTA